MVLIFVANVRKIVIDALSDIFSLLNVRSARCTRFEAGGKWAFKFPARPALKFAAVLRGECWIMLPGESPHHLVAGDAFLLAEAPEYVLANDPNNFEGLTLKSLVQLSQLWFSGACWR